MISSREPLRHRRLLPLAAGIIAFFAIADASANTFVYNCEDHGSGSLRYAVSVAPDGDLIDMRTLPCSKITLTTGAIQVPQYDLTFFGPGQDKLEITGKYAPGQIEQDRIFKHTGTGTIDFENLTISYGVETKESKGGCVYSMGSVSLGGAKVANCLVDRLAGKGGGIFATGELSLIFGTIVQNTIDEPASIASNYALGAGAYSVGGIFMTESTIDSNNIGGAGCSYRKCFGGGLFTFGNTKAYYSTISNNTASFAGGLAVDNHYTGSTVTLRQTTVSGNKATAANAGAYLNAETIDLEATTIAFNIAKDSFQGTEYYASGLTVGSEDIAINLTMNDTLISNNAYNFSVESDFGALSSKPVFVFGSNDFVRLALSTVPSGTISGECPWLGPLRNNGGLTQTHALMSHSPAIDSGKNVAAFQYDQRVYTFARVSGASQDIGAYEVQQDDIIFNANFNPCN